MSEFTEKVKKLLVIVDQQAEEVEELEDQIRGLDKQLADKDKQIAELKERIEDAKYLLNVADNKFNDKKEEIDDLEKQVQKWQRIRKPEHGTCCTCQRCGESYDDCRCDIDELADELADKDKEIADLKQTVSEVVENWNKYKAFLKDKYPAKDGEQWEFTCQYHQKLDQALAKLKAIGEI